MGTQQLLLIILGVIIVGISTLIGITLAKCGWSDGINAQGTFSFPRILSNRLRIEGIGLTHVRVRIDVCADSVGNPGSASLVIL